MFQIKAIGLNQLIPSKITKKNLNCSKWEVKISGKKIDSLKNLKGKF